MKYLLPLIILISLVGPSTRANDEPLPGQAKMTVEQRRSHKLAWVTSRYATSLRAGRLGEVLAITQMMLDRLKVDPGLAGSHEFALEANAFRSKIREKNRLAYSAENFRDGVTNSIPFDIANAALEVTPSVASFAPAASRLIRRAGQFIDEETAKYEQMEQQIDRMARAKRNENGLDILGAWYDLAHRDPAVASLDAIVLGEEPNLPPTASLDQVMLRASIFFPRNVMDVVSGVAPADPTKMYENTEVLRRFKPSSVKAKEVDGNLQPSARIALIKEDHKKETQMLDDAEAGFQALGGVLKLVGKGELGHKVRGIGVGAVSMARTISNFRASSQVYAIGEKAKLKDISKISSLKLTADLVSIVGDVISLFSSEPSFEQLVLQELGEIKSMLGDVRSEMHERFDAIDKNLVVIYDQMIAGFENLDDRSRHMERLISEMQTTLNRVDLSLRNLQGSMYTYLRAGFDRQLTVDEALCLNLEPGNANTDLNEVERCFAKFATFASSISADPLSADRNEFVVDDTLYFTLAEDGLLPNPWDKIGMMSVIAEKKLNYQALNPRTHELVNLLSWIRFTKDYLQMAERWPDIYRSYGSEKNTQRILQAGENLRTAVVNLTTTPSADGPLGDARFLEQVLGIYETKLEAFNTVLAERRAEVEKEVAAGFDLSEGINQLPKDGKTAFRLKYLGIPICDKTGVPGSEPGYRWDPMYAPKFMEKPFESEQSLKALVETIPAPYLHAHGMGLGIISICYGDLAWTEKKDIQPPHEFHKLAFSLMATLRTADGEFPIFTKRFVSTQYYMSHHVGEGQTLYDAFNHFHSGEHLHFVENDDAYNSLQAYVVQKKILSIEAARWEWSRKFIDGFAKNQGTEILTEDQKAKSLKSVSELLQEHIAAKVKPKVHQLVAANCSREHSLGMRLEELSGAKRLVQAFVSLAMPKATETDDEIYSLLFGAEQLIDSKLVIDKTDETPLTFWDGEASVSSVASQRLARLKTSIHDRVLSDGYRGQSPEILDVGILGLSAMMRLHDEQTPKQAIGAVFQELVSEVDELVRE
ncbi:MAG: hypothetical protein KDD51_05050 [Bdellovibrionales bacterium]|nr:hypothetical protein [Bdellovibrionales bacterium]